MTLHAPQVHGFFSVPVDHLTALGVLAEHFRAATSPTPWSSRPTSATPRPRPSSPGCSGLPVAAGSKQRLADDRVVIDAIVGDVAGKRAIVLDDEIATGGSIVELLDRLARPGLHRGRRRVHARAVRRQGRRAAARSPDDQRGRHHRHGARRRAPGPSCKVRSVAGLCSPRRSAGCTPASRSAACSTASTRPTARRSRRCLSTSTSTRSHAELAGRDAVVVA